MESRIAFSNNEPFSKHRFSHVHGRWGWGLILQELEKEKSRGTSDSKKSFYELKGKFTKESLLQAYLRNSIRETDEVTVASIRSLHFYRLYSRYFVTHLTHREYSSIISADSSFLFFWNISVVPAYRGS